MAIKNIWPSIQANSIYRVRSSSKPKSEPKAFIPKAILWKAKGESLNTMELQTSLNNELIKFLKGKV